MSGPIRRTWARQTAKQKLGIIAGVAAVLAFAVMGGFMRAAMYGPELDRATPAASSPAATPTEVTTSYLLQVVSDVIKVRAQVQGKPVAAPSLELDPCVSKWENANLTTLAAKGAYEVATVCGHPTAVLAGPSGEGADQLVYGALKSTAPAGIKQLLAGSTDRWIVVDAIRSADGTKQILAVSPRATN